MNLPDPINENGPAAPASTASNTDSNAAHVSPRAKTNVSKRSPSLSVTAEKVPCHTYIHHTYIHTYFMSCILNRIQLLNSLLLFTYYYPILLFIHTYMLGRRDWQRLQRHGQRISHHRCGQVQPLSLDQRPGCGRSPASRVGFFPD